MSNTNTRFSTWFMLVIISLLSFMMGIRMAIAASVHPIDFILLWVIAIIMIYLCIRDAGKNGRIILPIFRTIMFFTWPWSILFYYIRFHGWKGLILVLVWGLLFVVSYFAGVFIGVLHAELY